MFSEFHTVIDMQTLEKQQLMKSSALFRNLHSYEAAAVIARLQPMTYPRGTRIVERGVWHGQFWIVASGSVSVLLQEGVEGAQETALAHLRPGECFGEMSLITGEAPVATVRAQEDTVLWSLSQADFLTLIGECPTLSRNITSILSLRLAHANQQMMARQNVERVWLCFVDNPDVLLERSLAVHIAQALAERSHKRVLLLEVCRSEEAVGLHFARHADQVRPGLLTCTQEHSLLQRHKAPTVTTGGQHFPAIATLTDTSAVDLQEDLSQIPSWNESVWQTLTDLTGMYDYCLLVTTQATPTRLVQAAANLCQRAIILVSAQEGASCSARLAALPAFSASGATQRALFVAHVPEHPTIGVQDRYSAQLGCGVVGSPFEKARLTRLLPADFPLLERCQVQQATLREVMPGAALTKAVDFVARHIARQTVGIAFGGGGALGFAHIGVLKRLLERDIPLDYFSACSIGVITPGMHLMNRSLAEIEETFLKIERQITHWRFPLTSIFSNKGLKRAFLEVCGALRFEDLVSPFAVVAVDLAMHEGVVLDRGPLWQAALASVALPGIFPPVLLGNHVLMDGGMHDPVPISVVRKMGADILVASELGAQAEVEAERHQQQGRTSSPHIVDLLHRSYDMTMATIGMHSVREADAVIRPKLHRVSLRHFSRGHKFVAAGYEAVEEALPALQKQLPWLK